MELFFRFLRSNFVNMKIMKNLLFLALILTTFSQVFSQTGSRLKVLDIGQKAPEADRKMVDISGETYTLNSLNGKKGLLVIFSCNTCPFVINWEDRYPGITTLAGSNGINTVLVNSNEAKRNGEDSMEEMKKHALAKGYNSPYVIDKDHKIADAFGARTTPHVFLFDKDMVLVYKGAIDDNNDDASAVKEKWLENALNALGSGKKIEPAETRNLGCSIKRKS